ncbi:MAG: aspartate kinase [Cytophagales bacterium]|nr:aspartate kinase [Cytophagales bacterium]
MNWAQTGNLIKRDIPELLDKGVVLTQGFIGGTSHPLTPSLPESEKRGIGETERKKTNRFTDSPIHPFTNSVRNSGGRVTTTLGREGSDFSAAIYAYCLNADSVTIWKDVPGVLNADPKIIKHTTKYGKLSYDKAIEMAYYGASVIHPKTIKPLENKSIPLYVRSFKEPQKKGTTITYSGRATKIEKKVSHELQKNILQGTPSIIFKRDQCLMFLSVKDYSFVSEKNLSTIFNALAHLNIKINLMQNSAISFSICVDNDSQKIEKLRENLKNEFIFRSNENLQLITIMNFNVKTVKDLTRNREILLEQMTRGTFQVVVR